MTDERDSPLALSASEKLADDYSERAPTKPFNADLERPTTQGLLPDVSGMDVLDAGCGPGITTAYLLEADAEVTGIDASPAMGADVPPTACSDSESPPERRFPTRPYRGSPTDRGVLGKRPETFGRVSREPTFLSLRAVMTAD